MILAFLAFLDGNYIGMRFVLDVWTAQEPERLEVLRAREQEIATAVAAFNARVASRAASTVPAPTAPVGDSLPLPVTAPQPNPPTTASPQPQDPDPPTPPSTTPTNPTFASSTTTTTTTTPARTPLVLPTPAPLRPPQFGTLYARFSFTLLILVFLSLSALTSFPLLLRSLYTNTLVTLYLTLWLPQIHRNIIRNTRKPLLWRFVIGQSLLRLVPVAYFWCVEGNVLDAATDVRGFAVLASWMAAQVCVLASQSVLGPRWCVSEKWSWVPEAWEWRPVLREGDEEKGLVPVGGSVVVKRDGAIREDEDEGKRESENERETLVPGNGKVVERVYDCAICMQSVRVPVLPASSDAARQDRVEGGIRRTRGQDTVMGRLSEVFRRVAERARTLWVQRSNSVTGMDEEDYAITPCRHVFHWQCIASWLQYRSNCAICRTGLPSM